MSVFVVNEPMLRDAKGTPHLFVGPECYECDHEQRFHVTRMVDGRQQLECRHRMGDAREEVCGCDMFLSGEGVEYSLAQWVGFFMENLPVGHLRNVDWRRSRIIQDACEAAAASTEGVIAFNDDHYKWLMDILFDDTEGQRIRAEGLSPAAKAPEGPWATNHWPSIAISVEQALWRRVKGPDDLTLVGDAEGADGKVRALPALSRPQQAKGQKRTGGGRR